MAICILLSTCDRYLPIAVFTVNQLQRNWAYHPKIMISGVSGNINGLYTFPLVDDPKDWLGITLNACYQMLGLGYTKCYLILDDHPPIAKCNHLALNKSLPHLMDVLNASIISLYGWGQSDGARKPNGKVLGKKFCKLENVDTKFQWKFSLHPGLWRIDSLIVILNKLIDRSSCLEDRTPWCFERHSGEFGFDIADDILTGAYRICGRFMTENRRRLVIRRTELLVCDTLHFMANKIFGINAWNWLYSNLSYIYHYYEGPYPIFWRGLLDKGEVNRDALKYLKLHNLDIGEIPKISK